MDIYCIRIVTALAVSIRSRTGNSFKNAAPSLTANKAQENAVFFIIKKKYF
jgi:hypothetical protein